MKNPLLLTLITALILAAGTALISLSVRAEKLDLETHNNLIQKLESAVQISQSDSMISQPALAHRLADLYAERARLMSLENEGQGDKTNRKKIHADRMSALTVYKKILETLDKDEKGIVLMQMAHLNNLENTPDVAQAIYKRIVTEQKSYRPAIVALAHIQLGDIQFLKGDLDHAQVSFAESIAINENPRLAYSKFRLAWTHFNLGQTKQAEREVISLLNQSGLFVGKSGTLDVSFQEEVSHDLATFMAKNDIEANSIAILSQLSPEGTRQKNLTYLAKELDRTAKKNSALKVWAVVGAHELSQDDKIEKQIEVTRIQYDLGKKPELLVEIDKSIVLLKDAACINSQECVVGLQNLRKIITDWGKAEERAPSVELISAYQKYTSHFNDFEMTYWAAQSANRKKLYPEAFQFYKTAAHLAQSTQGKNPERTAKIFEGSLLGAIEVAELSKNRTFRVESYQLYLQMNPNGQKSSDVRYQTAHWSYEGGDYTKASEQFRLLALDKKIPSELRIKSADLCLDSDVLLKNESQIETHALELANAIKSKSTEYSAIWRKSILNQSAKVINSKTTTEGLEAEMKKINSIKVAAWPSDQKKLMTKNKILLSLRLKNMDELGKASAEMLALPNLDGAERNESLRQLAWIAELKLNFSEALKYLSQVHPSKVELADHLFKIATLKELSSQDPSAEFTKYIAVAKNDLKKQYAAHQLVLSSSKAKLTFAKYESLLAKNSTLYSSAGVFVFEKTNDQRLANRLLAKASVRNSDLGKVLAHAIALRDFGVSQKALGQMKLVQAHDRQLRHQLTTRIKALKSLEIKTNYFIAKKDTTLELVYLSQLAAENTRLAKEILTLPSPKGLKKSEMQQYQAQVQTMVLPYQQQAERIQKKAEELWAKAIARNVYKNLFDLSEQSRPGSQLAKNEISLLKQSASRIGLENDPFRIFSEQRQKASLELESLKHDLKENPFNSSYLEKLKQSQMSLGGGPMIAYLDGRLSALKQTR